MPCRLGVALVVALLCTGMGHAQERNAHQPDSMATRSDGGTGFSYWGPIGGPTDSTSTVFANIGMPFWEAALVWPYRVVSSPVRLVALGLGEGIDFLDHSNTLRKVGQLLGPRRGPIGMLVNIQAGGLAGMGGGLAFEHTAFLGSNNRLRVGGRTTTRGNHHAYLGVHVGLEGPRSAEVGIGWRVRPNARYFGLGPEAGASSESYFRHEAFWFGAGYRRALGANFSVLGDATYSAVDAGRPGEDESPPITDVFVGNLPAGFGERSCGVTLGLALAHDDVEGGGRPGRGGTRRFRVAYFEGLGDADVAFWTYRGEAQQFVTLWHRHHVLALRGYMSWIDNAGSARLPFQRLMTNDDPDLLRGYEDFRWRARGIVALSAEYRWPLWVLNRADGPGLDMYLLGDVGQVYDDIDEITGANMTFSYGAGIRVIGARDFVARLEYGRSVEQAVWRLRFDQVFQFSKGGISDGRVPIPDR